MALLSRQPWCAASALLVPLVSLASPAWLKLAGVPPDWAVLWLLPWALVDGRLSGALAGLAIGLLLDATVPGAVSQIPGLMLLGWWWGRIGRRGPPIQRSFSLGLLALFGSLFLNLTLLLQWGLRSWRGGVDAARLSIGGSVGMAGSEQGLHPALLALPGWHLQDLAAAGLHVLVAQTLLTALLAPMLCSLQVLLWRQITSGGRV
jgi:rod shape-determining protein MreD